MKNPIRVEYISEARRWIGFGQTLRLFLLLMAILQARPLSAANPVSDFAPIKSTAAFYSEHCVRCHKEGKAKGGFRMDELLARPSVQGQDDPWKNVLEKLVAREMPPDDEEKRPSHDDYEKQIAWLRTELEKSEQAMEAARPRAQRRLNRAEYNRTVSDLFGYLLRPADAFPPDDALHGFDTVAEGLNTSTVLLERYLAAAQEVAARVTEDFGPQVPEVRTFRQAVSPQDGETSGADFELYDGNSMFYWGGTPQKWERREWIGHSWGAVLRPRHSGRYTVKLFGKLKRFAPGERGIFRLEFAGRTVGVFDSPAEPRADDLLFQTDVQVDKTTAGHGVAVFTFVNGNPHGKAVGETDDYHPNSYERFREFKQKHFPEHFEKTSDTWMPHEPPGLDVRAIANVRCEITGPHHDVWPPVGFQREFAMELKAKDLQGVMAGFLPRAFRRPVTAAEVTRIVAFAESGTFASAAFDEKLRAALTRILVAPEFLFLVEAVPSGTPRGGYRLTNWELAARLSYFLTGTMPDADLRAAAARGELSDGAKLDAQVTRLLRDQRTVAALTAGFANSWLHLDRLAGVMPEPKLFPQFGDDLKRSFAEEPKAFFAALVIENGRVTDLLDADHAWVNERLAMHYGLDRATIRGSELRRVTLPVAQRPQRGGLLGMGALLTLTSENTRTSPVKRGIYVLEQIFNRPPPPPPPNVGDLIPNTASAKSVREHLALHRADPACAGCHNRIDPWGLALENFDAVGAWRTEEAVWEDPSRPVRRKQGEIPVVFPINARFELPRQSDAARHATGLNAARAELQHRRDEFARGFTEKLMTYALGRGLLLSDRQHIEAAAGALKKEDYRLHALIRAIIHSPAFQTR